MAAKFKRSPEQAVEDAATRILEAREMDPVPRELVGVFLSKKYGPLMLGAVVLLIACDVFLKGQTYEYALESTLIFLALYTILWGLVLAFCKYMLHKESVKPEYDWAVEYKILHESDQELNLVEELLE